MHEFWSVIYPWIVSGIGGFIGAALLLPTKLGEAIIKFQFDKSIEVLKANSARELAKLTEQLNHLNDRGKRSNEREFEAIVSIWQKFVDCFDRAEAAIVQYTEVPDLGNFTPEEIESFLSTREFSKEQINQVKDAKDRERTYGQLVRWKYIAIAHNTIFETRTALRKELFIPPVILSDIENAIEHASVAVMTELTRFQNPNIGLSTEASLKFFRERNDIFLKIKDSVQKRLLRSESNAKYDTGTSSKGGMNGAPESSAS